MNNSKASTYRDMKDKIPAAGTIKNRIYINFTDFWGDFDKENNDFINILRKSYDVEISDNPDFLFYSCFGYDFLKYDCPRIFFAGECQSPDFNVCDYAIAFDRINYGDRYLRLPLYMIGNYQVPYLSLNSRPKFTKEDISKKTDFCSFVYSNCFAGDFRAEFYRLLSGYKKVDSGGRYLNNVGGPVDDKYAFERSHKFSIAFENTVYPGYITEKIMGSFYAGTVPIYYGAPDVELDFNKGSFINCHDFGSFDEVVEYIKEVDNNDELYLSILNQKPAVENNCLEDFEQFLLNIVSQDRESAYRRPDNPYAFRNYEIIKRHQWYEKSIHKAVHRTKIEAGKIRKKMIG